MVSHPPPSAHPARWRESNGIRAVLGDAAAVIADLPDESFDACVTDPPYGISITKNEAGVGRPHWDRSRIAFDPDFWTEVHRVLKPGANLAAFGDRRTFARMSVAIEDAGFELVDTLAWIHGQGYPAGFRHLDCELARLGHDELAVTYAGWGNTLRPGFEPIVLARKLRPKSSLSRVLAAGGSGGFNIDATRIAAGVEDRSRPPGRPQAHNTFRVSRPARAKSTPPAAGRTPSNVLIEHQRGCTSIACEAGCPVQVVQTQGREKRRPSEDAARFYSTFYHHPKASVSERPRVGNIVGPAVKPLGVMNWILTLTTRPGDNVLDPFAGTGTTLEACRGLARSATGIEREPDYLKLIYTRLGWDPED